MTKKRETRVFHVEMEIYTRHVVVVDAPDYDAAEGVAHGLSPQTVRTRTIPKDIAPRTMTRVLAVREPR